MKWRIKVIYWSRCGVSYMSSTVFAETKGEETPSLTMKMKGDREGKGEDVVATSSENLQMRKNKRSFDDVRIFEYTSAANPDLSEQPVLAHPASLHQSGPTRVIPFDLSKAMDISYPCTSPNLLASFVRICEGESVESQAVATSQGFYVIRGSGKSQISGESETVEWEEGDLFVVPSNEGGKPKNVLHSASKDAALYWVSDEPLLKYLGVGPIVEKFNLTHYRREVMLNEVERISHEPGVEHRNRMGILLGNKSTEDNTKTLTHTLWSLLNVLPAGDAQRPHRHNSVALDLCVSAKNVVDSEGKSKIYTLMGPELDGEGWVKDPIKCEWTTGSVFTTPPGWWHSHHNESDEAAWVLPMQDAGLLTHQRILDIRFAPPLKKKAT